MLAVLGTISTFKSKENWERADLITLGDNVMKSLSKEDVSEILNKDFSKIESLIPPNVNFGIKVSGIPKDNITVGCIPSYCSYVNLLFTPTYLNNRWINFSVEATGDPEWTMSYFDVITLVNFTTYSDPLIKDYLKRGKTIIGINATYSTSNLDFNEVFDLTSTTSGGGTFNFTTYNPSEDEIQKYFFAFGFDINTSNSIDSKKWGNWYIWGIPRKVNITSSNTVEVENKTSDEGFIRNILEGGFFNIKNISSNKFYTFKVKKIFWDSTVILQPMNVSFAFNDFSEANDVRGKVNIIISPNGQAEMTSNNTAIWISDFPPSNEYQALVKAAALSRVKDWYLKNPDLTKEYVALSSFYPLCCEMPETAELTLYLWYKI